MTLLTSQVVDLGGVFILKKESKIMKDKDDECSVLAKNGICLFAEKLSKEGEKFSSLVCPFIEKKIFVECKLRKRLINNSPLNE